MAFAPRGDLYDCVRTNVLNADAALFYTSEILCGLAYLHGRDIVHKETFNSHRSAVPFGYLFRTAIVR